MGTVAVRGAEAVRDEGWLPVAEAASLPVDRVLAALGSDAGRAAPRPRSLRRRSRLGPERGADPPGLRPRRPGPPVPLRAAGSAAGRGGGLRASSASAPTPSSSGSSSRLSVGLGFVNEYRAERAGAALHDRVRHTAPVVRAGAPRRSTWSSWSPATWSGSSLGMVVPADLRLRRRTGLECDESVLTGESAAVAQDHRPGAGRYAAGRPASLRADGHRRHGRLGHRRGGRHRRATPRSAGSPPGSATGSPRPSSRPGCAGSPAAGPGRGRADRRDLRHQPVLHRPLIDAVLFCLAIAVGITPQLLPAIVTTSLADRARAAWPGRGVLVKRLVCVEDLGNIEVLFTDKTGTLTEGRLSLRAALGPDGYPATARCCSAARQRGDRSGHGSAATRWTWRSGGARRGAPAGRRVPARALLPFDHERRRVSVLVDGPDGRLWSPRARPRTVLASAIDVPAAARAVARRASSPRGGRVIAVASRPAAGPAATLTADDERDLTSPAFWSSSTRPSRTPRRRCDRLASLGITIKVITGDHPASPSGSARDLGLPVRQRAAPAPTSTALDDDRAAQRPIAADHRLRPGQPRSTRPASSAPQRPPAATWRSSATASTTRSPCTPPTSASPSTPPPTWPRTPPTSSCWTRTSACSPTASPRAGASSPTPSSTC